MSSPVSVKSLLSAMGLETKWNIGWTRVSRDCRIAVSVLKIFEILQSIAMINFVSLRWD